MVFGLFKSRFPKLDLGPQLGKYEAKGFVSQKKIKLDWPHGPDALALFVPHLLQEELYYYTGLAKLQRDLMDQIDAYLAAPNSPTWEITDDVKPENYLLLGGIWNQNGIGGRTGSIGGPAGPEVDAARGEMIKALLKKTGNDPRSLAACKHVIAFQRELGDETNYKKRGGRVAEAWRLANGGAPPSR
jgi:hypothetical protein